MQCIGRDGALLTGVTRAGLSVVARPSISRIRPEKMFFLPFFSTVNKPALIASAEASDNSNACSTFSCGKTFNFQNTARENVLLAFLLDGQQACLDCPPLERLKGAPVFHRPTTSPVQEGRLHTAKIGRKYDGWRSSLGAEVPPLERLKGAPVFHRPTTSPVQEGRLHTAKIGRKHSSVHTFRWFYHRVFVKSHH